MQPLELNLDTLHFGHDAEPPINIRRVGREDAIPELAASIGAHGMIHPLSVRSIGDKWFVADGNRRLAALAYMATHGELAGDAIVQCLECDQDADAEEISLAANIMRQPLHEADQYETFRDLHTSGSDEAEIASRFGIEPNRVRRILAIGSLDPVILKAWRDGDLKHDAVNIVRAFTLAKDHKDQVRVLKKLKKGGALYSHNIRREFGADDSTANKFLKAVGTDAYIQAGGEIVEDLFGEDHAISDGALVAKLANEKLIARRDELREAGWSWAELREDMPNDWSWNWQKIETTEDKASKATKAKSGCVVEISYKGEIEVTVGVVKPEKTSKKSDATNQDGNEEKPAPTLSASLTHKLSVQATNATAKALADEPRLGLVALLAGFLSPQFTGPIRVRHDGHTPDTRETTETFADTFDRLEALDDAELFRIAAGIAASALSLTRHNGGDIVFDDSVNDFAASIDAGTLLPALREAFDAEDYFASAKKSFIVKAIEEAINADEARKAGKMKKPDLVAYAVKNVPPTGWLPPEIRPSTYDGPGMEASNG